MASSTSGPIDTAPHRLPTTVRPSAYRLELAPDLEAATFAGEVAIDIDVAEEVGSIVLNAIELSISSATIVRPGDTSPSEAASIDFDEHEERVTLTFATPVPAGPATVHLTFTGILNDMLHGFYRSTFTDADGVERVIATTQMESTDARRAFPCFDEPECKATFEVTLVVADGLAAYSNSAQVDELSLEDGRRRVRFAPTMIMSTYLVAFVVGPLEHTDPVDVDGVPLRIVHPLGKGHLTDFALEVGAHALRFFRSYFDIPYPADKLDMVAIPDFAFGAMENVGCVTYREALLLVDPARASRLELERVADVICHEIAHMWFGNLVTMKWWNGIWLNEAFATMMEVLACDAFRPDWERWVSFGVEREAALAVDGLHSTRPVEFPVGRPEEAEAMFDVLTYQKGGSVLRMLEQFIGPDVFRDGIHDYLTTHAYGNTETADLWAALERASGRDVGSIMSTWIDQGGYPLVTVDDQGKLAQQPFSYSGEPGGAIGSDWEIPVLHRTLSVATTTPELLSGARSSEPLADPADLVVNAGGSGYYRVAYSSDHLARLAGRLGDLAPLERYNLVSDAWAAALSGHAPAADVFNLARALRDGGEQDPSVWSVILGAVGMAERVVPDADRMLLADATRALLSPLLADLGWDPQPGEGERVPTLRSGVLRVLGTTGADADVRAEAARRFAASESAPLHPDIASAVLDIVASMGSNADYDTFVARYQSPATPQEEDRYLYALASFMDRPAAERTFTLCVTEVRTQDAPFVIQRLLANRVTGPEIWADVRDAWDVLGERLPTHLIPRMLDGVRLLCADPLLADDVTRFIRDNPPAAGPRTVDQILERLAINVAFAQREGAGVAANLAAAVSV